MEKARARNGAAVAVPAGWRKREETMIGLRVTSCGKRRLKKIETKVVVIIYNSPNLAIKGSFFVHFSIYLFFFRFQFQLSTSFCLLLA